MFGIRRFVSSFPFWLKSFCLSQINVEADDQDTVFMGNIGVQIRNKLVSIVIGVENRYQPKTWTIFKYETLNFILFDLKWKH